MGQLEVVAMPYKNTLWVFFRKYVIKSKNKGTIIDYQ